MKDIRGSHVSAVKSAIFKYFKLQSTSSRRKPSIDVAGWKSSKNVNESYKKLYDDASTLENIIDIAFLSLPADDEEEYSDMYIYTASVYDIILNPKYPSNEVTKRPLELRFNKFKVFIEFNLLSNLICCLKSKFIRNLINNLEHTQGKGSSYYK